MATASVMISLRTPVATLRFWFWRTTSIISKSLVRRCPVAADIKRYSAYGMKDRTSLIFLVYSYMVLSVFSMASHLFTATMIPLPLSWAIPAILASCSVTPSVASMTTTTTSARSTADTVRIML